MGSFDQEIEESIGEQKPVSAPVPLSGNPGTDAQRTDNANYDSFVRALIENTGGIPQEFMQDAEARHAYETGIGRGRYDGNNMNAYRAGLERAAPAQSYPLPAYTVMEEDGLIRDD